MDIEDKKLLIKDLSARFPYGVYIEDTRCGIRGRLRELFVMLLWNWVMVDIFKLPAINYLQALGLWLLPKLLIHRVDVRND